MVLILLSLILVFFTVIGCQVEGPHMPVESPPPSVPSEGGPSAAPSESDGPTYADVRPLFEKFCGRCHGVIATPDWLQFEQAQAVALSGRLVQRVWNDRDTPRAMPQPGTPEAQAITLEDRELIRKWAENGAPLELMKEEEERVSESPPPPSPSSAPFPPMSEPSLVAMPTQACSSCHGESGVSFSPLIPNLAGQNKKYLLIQLKAFQKKERASEVMQEQVKDLIEAEMEFLAEYFSRMPRVGNEDFENQEPPDERLVELGKQIGRRCIQCHANWRNNAIINGWPSLAGQKIDYMVDELKSFRSKERKNSYMNYFMGVEYDHWTDEELQAVSSYFNSLR